MNKKGGRIPIIKTAIRFIGPLVLVVILFFIDINKVVDALFKLRWDYFAFSILLIPFLVFIRSFRWKRILAKFDIYFSHWKCFRICFVSFASLAVVAVVGSFVKILYCRHDGYGTLEPVISVVAEKYFDFIVPLVFGLIAISLLAVKFPVNLAFLVVIPVACLSFYPSKLIIKHVYPKSLSNFLKKRFGFNWRLRDHLRSLEFVLDFRTYLLSMAGFIVGAYAKVYLLALSLSLDLPFLQLALIMSITSIVTLVPISYFGIGTRELGLLGAFELFGYSAEKAIALSVGLLCFRIVLVLLATVFLVFYPPPHDHKEKSK